MTIFVSCVAERDEPPNINSQYAKERYYILKNSKATFNAQSFTPITNNDQKITEEWDSIRAYHRLELYDMLGEDNYIKLFSYLQEYLKDNSGSFNPVANLPDGLEPQQIDIFLLNALFIEKIAKPIYEEMVSNSNDENDQSVEVANSNHLLCEVEAALKLALLGVDIGVADLAAIVTGGAAVAPALLEDLALMANLSSIYLEYEVCCGRWHNDKL